MKKIFQDRSYIKLDVTSFCNSSTFFLNREFSCLNFSFSELYSLSLSSTPDKYCKNSNSKYILQGQHQLECL